MKKPDGKRLLCLLLALILCLQGLFLPAAAAEPGLSVFDTPIDTTVGLRYSDLDSGKYYYSSVCFALNHGLLSGANSATIRPDDPLTAATCLMGAVLLYERYHGITATDKPLAAEAWYETYVRRGRAYGIIREESFNATALISEAHMSALLYRSLPSRELQAVWNYVKMPGMNETDPWYNEMFKLYRAGVLAPYDNLKPTGNFTRAQFCVILRRLLLPQYRNANPNPNTYTQFPVDLNHLQCSYSDVKSGDWFYKAVASQQMLGILNGTGGGKFSPSGSVTIAQAITSAVRIYETWHGCEIAGAPGPHWYDLYVNKALACGIIQRGQFSNYAAVATRRQTVTILYRALPESCYPGIVDIRERTYAQVSSAMPDFNSKCSGYAQVINWYRAGILTGSDEYGSFFPDQSIKRSELAAIVLRMVVPIQRQIRSFLPCYQLSFGSSYQGRDLTVYQIGNGRNVMLLNFAIHGWEDNFDRDGQMLADTAIQLLDTLKGDFAACVGNPGWTVYIIPTANPDGLYAGRSSYGPGRCTAQGYDLNRSFPAGFRANWSSRYYNGGQALLAVEAKALYTFTRSVKGSSKNVLFDVHGWYNQIMTSGGRGKVYQTMHSYFPGCVYESLWGCSGYYGYWGATIGYDACLFEFPYIDSPSRFRSSGYGPRFCNAIRSLLKSY